MPAGKLRAGAIVRHPDTAAVAAGADRKSTRLNSSHSQISYAVFCLKKKKERCCGDRSGGGASRGGVARRSPLGGRGWIGRGRGGGGGARHAARADGHRGVVARGAGG